MYLHCEMSPLASNYISLQLAGVCIFFFNLDKKHFKVASLKLTLIKNINSKITNISKHKHNNMLLTPVAELMISKLMTLFLGKEHSWH